jgi:hypothetical protein
MSRASAPPASAVMASAALSAAVDGGLASGVARFASGATVFADSPSVRAGLDLLELLGVPRHETVKAMHDGLREHVRGESKRGVVERARHEAVL